MREYYQAQNMEGIIKAYTTNGHKEGFIQVYKKNLRSLNPSKKGNYSSRISGEEGLSALVSDPAFASVLNENLEIQVGSNLYKVTPYGTFIQILKIKKS